MPFTTLIGYCCNLWFGWKFQMNPQMEFCNYKIVQCSCCHIIWFSISDWLCLRFFYFVKWIRRLLLSIGSTEAFLIWRFSIAISFIVLHNVQCINLSAIHFQYTVCSPYSLHSFTMYACVRLYFVWLLNIYVGKHTGVYRMKWTKIYFISFYSSLFTCTTQKTVFFSSFISFFFFSSLMWWLCRCDEGP